MKTGALGGAEQEIYLWKSVWLERYKKTDLTTKSSLHNGFKSDLVNLKVGILKE